MSELDPKFYWYDSVESFIADEPTIDGELNDFYNQVQSFNFHYHIHGGFISGTIEVPKDFVSFIQNGWFVRGKLSPDEDYVMSGKIRFNPYQNAEISTINISGFIRYFRSTLESLPIREYMMAKVEDIYREIVDYVSKDVQYIFPTIGFSSPQASSNYLPDTVDYIVDQDADSARVLGELSLITGGYLSYGFFPGSVNPFDAGDEQKRDTTFMLVRGIPDVNYRVPISQLSTYDVVEDESLIINDITVLGPNTDYVWSSKILDSINRYGRVRRWFKKNSLVSNEVGSFIVGVLAENLGYPTYSFKYSVPHENIAGAAHNFVESTPFPWNSRFSITDELNALQITKTPIMSSNLVFDGTGLMLEVESAEVNPDFINVFGFDEISDKFIRVPQAPQNVVNGVEVDGFGESPGGGIPGDDVATDSSARISYIGPRLHTGADPSDIPEPPTAFQMPQYVSNDANAIEEPLKNDDWRIKYYWQSFSNVRINSKFLGLIKVGDARAWSKSRVNFPNANSSSKRILFGPDILSTPVLNDLELRYKYLDFHTVYSSLYGANMWTPHYLDSGGGVRALATQWNRLLLNYQGEFGTQYITRDYGWWASRVWGDRNPPSILSSGLLEEPSEVVSRVPHHNLIYRAFNSGKAERYFFMDPPNGVWSEASGSYEPVYGDWTVGIDLTPWTLISHFGQRLDHIFDANKTNFQYLLDTYGGYENIYSVEKTRRPYTLTGLSPTTDLADDYHLRVWYFTKEGAERAKALGYFWDLQYVIDPIDANPVMTSYWSGTYESSPVPIHGGIMIEDESDVKGTMIEHYLHEFKGYAGLDELIGGMYYYAPSVFHWLFDYTLETGAKYRPGPQWWTLKLRRIKRTFTSITPSGVNARFKNAINWREWRVRGYDDDPDANY